MSDEAPRSIASLNVLRMRPNHLVVTDPTSSLTEAIELMLLHWVNALPVIAQVPLAFSSPANVIINQSWI